MFYAQSHSFLEFLEDREGASFVGEVARLLGRGIAMTDILKCTKQVPSDLPSAEHAWREWVRSR